MAVQLVGLDAAGNPECGHSRAEGYPGEAPNTWWCALCGGHTFAQLDQELAPGAARVRQPDAAPARGEA